MPNGNGQSEINRKADEIRAEQCLKELQKVLADFKCVMLARTEIIGGNIRSGVLVQVQNPTMDMVQPVNSIIKP